MTRGILITGNDSSLFSAVAGETAKRVESFATALIPNRFPLPEGGRAVQEKDEINGNLALSWNPSSSISARTLVLAAENRLGQINDAIIICSPPAVYKTAETLSPEEIEILVNDQIKGWFLLIRELIIYFRREQRGSLSLVAPEEASQGEKWTASSVRLNQSGKNASGKQGWNRVSQADLLGPSAGASFRAFAQGILNSHGNEPFHIMGFTGAEAGAEEEFASWFFKTLDEGSAKNRGRWLKFSKRKIFNF